MRHAFLAILARAPAHGYDLKHQLEQRFGDLLGPLNAGQIYTTLARLERDGFVRGVDVAGDGRGKRVYALTPDGRGELDGWVAQPAPAARMRDEFFMKLVLAGLAGVADPRAMIAAQRREYLQSLRDLDALATSASGVAPISELLVEGAALHLKADLEWLDLCEQRLVRQEEPDDSAA